MCKKEKDLGLYRSFLDDVIKNYGDGEYSGERYSYLLTLPISCIVGMYRYIFAHDENFELYVYVLDDLKSIMAHEFAKTF